VLGKIYDNETGLYYLRARYYDPQVGRFINEDTDEGTVTDPLSLNWYTYCENDPVDNIDPTGHGILDIGFGAYDIGEFINDPSWGNAGWVAFDAVTMLDPTDISDGLAHGAKAIKAISKVGKVAKAGEHLADVAKGEKEVKAVIKLYASYKDVMEVKAVTDPMRAAMKRILNNMEPLNERHMEALFGDLIGSPIVKNGKVYDHLQEVLNARNGMLKGINSLKKSLKNPKLPSWVITYMENLVNSGEKYINRVNEVLDKGGYKH
jgi:RHS repeat-associated protein